MKKIYGNILHNIKTCTHVIYILTRNVNTLKDKRYLCARVHRERIIVYFMCITAAFGSLSCSQCVPIPISSYDDDGAHIQSARYRVPTF